VIEPSTWLAVALAAPPSPFIESWVESWSEFQEAQWQERSQYGNWYTQYAGFGTISIVGMPGSALEVYPEPSREPSVTHAGLVTTTQSLNNLLLSASMTTVRQLRTPNPNPWEVGWILWHYQDDHHFYYLILKPNGWELGKKVPDSADQRFLLAGPTPTFPVGVHTVKVLQIGPTIQVVGDGQLLGTFVDRDNPYLTGSVGLYTEDAQVRFGVVSAETLP
jgi:hypothetical protein